MTEMKDRIKQIMEDRKMTQQEFADFLEQSPATLSSIFNGRTRPTINVVDSLKKKIPDINTDWLLFGIGNMYMPAALPNSTENAEGQPDVQDPMLPFDAPVFEQTEQKAAAPQPTFYQGTRGSRSESVREEVRLVAREPRCVTEIRVYYDDQTYETFVPAKK